MVRLTTLSTTAQAYNLDIRSSSFNVTTDADLLNTGTLALGNGAADLLNFNGGLRAVGQSAITLAGQLTTSNARVALAALTLNSSSSIASGTAAASTISLAAVTAGTFNLSVAAGTNTAAAFTASSITGTGKLSVASAGSATFSGAVSMATVELGTITGAVSFSNNLSASTFTTTSYLSSLSLLGSTTVITNPVTIFSNGTVTLGDGGDTLTFNGGFVNTTSPTTLNGYIQHIQ
jgi:hypothetical protein